MVLQSGRDLSEALEVVEIRVRASGRERLDRYLLRRLGWGSRTKVQRLVELGRVEVNDQPAKCAQRVRVGDHIRVRMVTAETAHESHHPLPPPLWEDPYLAAIAKPAGRLVHPTGKTLSGTVVDELHGRYRGVNDRGRRRVTPRLCHRLDRDTSGLLLVAKTVEMRRAIQEAFENGEVRKGYLAAVGGRVESDQFEVDAAISEHLDAARPHSNRLARLDDEGRRSLTRFTVLGRGQGHSVVHCFPVTGRQNQIRIHLASVGYPILGDTGFGSDPGTRLPADLPFPRRALLHSAQLRFRHPVWGTERELRCPPAEDLQPFLVAAGVTEAGVPPLRALGESSDPASSR